MENMILCLVKPQILTGPNQKFRIKQLEMSKTFISLITQLNPRLFCPALTANGTLLLVSSSYLSGDRLPDLATLWSP